MYIFLRIYDLINLAGSQPCEYVLMHIANKFLSVDIWYNIVQGQVISDDFGF